MPAVFELPATSPSINTTGQAPPRLPSGAIPQAANNIVPFARGLPQSLPQTNPGEPPVIPKGRPGQPNPVEPYTPSENIPSPVGYPPPPPHSDSAIPNYVFSPYTGKFVPLPEGYVPYAPEESIFDRYASNGIEMLSQLVRDLKAQSEKPASLPKDIPTRYIPPGSPQAPMKRYPFTGGQKPGTQYRISLLLTSDAVYTAGYQPPTENVHNDYYTTLYLFGPIEGFGSYDYGDARRPGRIYFVDSHEYGSGNPVRTRAYTGVEVIPFQGDGISATGSLKLSLLELTPLDGLPDNTRPPALTPFNPNNYLNVGALPIRDLSPSPTAPVVIPDVVPSILPPGVPEPDRPNLIPDEPIIIPDHPPSLPRPELPPDEPEPLTPTPTPSTPNPAEPPYYSPNPDKPPLKAPNLPNPGTPPAPIKQPPPPRTPKPSPQRPSPFTQPGIRPSDPTPTPTKYDPYIPGRNPNLDPKPPSQPEPDIPPQVDPQSPDAPDAPDTEPPTIPATTPTPTETPVENPQVIPPTIPDPAPYPGTNPTIAPTPTPAPAPGVTPADVPSIQPGTKPAPDREISPAPTPTPAPTPGTLPTSEPEIAPAQAPGSSPAKSPNAIPGKLPAADPSTIPQQVPEPTTAPVTNPAVSPAVIESPATLPQTQTQQIPQSQPNEIPRNEPIDLVGSPNAPTVTTTINTLPPSEPLISPTIPDPSPSLSTPTTTPSEPTDRPSSLPNTVPRSVLPPVSITPLPPIECPPGCEPVCDMQCKLEIVSVMVKVFKACKIPAPTTPTTPTGNTDGTTTSVSNVGGTSVTSTTSTGSVSTGINSEGNVTNPGTLGTPGSSSSLQTQNAYFEMRTVHCLKGEEDKTQLLFERMAYTEALQCNPTDAIAAVPEWWEVRVGQRPQLVVLYADVGKDGKAGGSRWAMTIPHYNKKRTYKPNFPTYEKGSIEGILRLSDNSSIIVNAATSTECKRVLNDIKQYLPQQMLKGSVMKIGERFGAAYKKVRVTPVSAKFFSKGQSNSKPDWVIDLRKK